MRIVLAIALTAVILFPQLLVTAGRQLPWPKRPMNPWGLALTFLVIAFAIYWSLTFVFPGPSQ